MRDPRPAADATRKASPSPSATEDHAPSAEVVTPPPASGVGLAGRPWARIPVAALLVFAAVLLASRFLRLGERPLHHDESIHAFQSLQLARDGTWRYDPAYHGPFLYYANAL